jgi:hypothetical protein
MRMKKTISTISAAAAALLSAAALTACSPGSAEGPQALFAPASGLEAAAAPAPDGRASAESRLQRAVASGRLSADAAQAALARLDARAQRDPAERRAAFESRLESAVASGRMTAADAQAALERLDLRAQGIARGDSPRDFRRGRIDGARERGDFDRSRRDRGGRGGRPPRAPAFS